MNPGHTTSIIKSIALLLSIMMNWVGLLAVGETVASFNDTEASPDNTFFAGALDFALLPPEFASGIDNGETIAYALMIDHATTTVRSQYAIRTEEASTTPGVSHGFCLALALDAWLGSTSTPKIFSGPLLNFTFAATASTTIPTETLPLEVMATTSAGYAQGDICAVRFVLDAFQIGSIPDFGFHDRSFATATFTARTAVVLNEFLPNPDEEAGGFNFGKDSDNMPLGEWVELYNNSDASLDIAGWYIADESGGTGNTQAIISAGNTAPATTTIPAKGWLVVYFNKPVMNNTGDTLYLYTDDDKLVDSYSYGGHDLCSLDPTPGDENDTTGSGSGCSANPAAPLNKSYARVPDGVGDWVDPIPTPGEPNTAEMLPPEVFPDAPEGVPDAPANNPDEDVLPVATTTGDAHQVADILYQEEIPSPAPDTKYDILNTDSATSTDTTESAPTTLSEKLGRALESSPMEYPEPKEEETAVPAEDTPTTTPVTEQIESPGARVEEQEEEEIIPTSLPQS